MSHYAAALVGAMAVLVPVLILIKTKRLIPAGLIPTEHSRALLRLPNLPPGMAWEYGPDRGSYSKAHRRIRIRDLQSENRIVATAPYTVSKWTDPTAVHEATVIAGRELYLDNFAKLPGAAPADWARP